MCPPYSVCFEAAGGPPVGAAGGLFGPAAIGRVADWLVEGHDDVRADGVLNLNGGFGGEEVLRSVYVRAEGDAVVSDLEEGGEAEDLIAAAVGEGGAGPAHEGGEAAGLFDELEAGAEVEVIGIGQDDLGAEAEELFLGERLDGGLGSDRQESGRIEGVAADREAAGAGAGRVGIVGVELEHWAWPRRRCAKRLVWGRREYRREGRGVSREKGARCAPTLGNGRVTGEGAEERVGGRWGFLGVGYWLRC